jgi:hypothetical protein
MSYDLITAAAQGNGPINNNTLHAEMWRSGGERDLDPRLTLVRIIDHYPTDEEARMPTVGGGGRLRLRRCRACETVSLRGRHHPARVATTTTRSWTQFKHKQETIDLFFP